MATNSLVYVVRNSFVFYSVAKEKVEDLYFQHFLPS